MEAGNVEAIDKNDSENIEVQLSSDVPTFDDAWFAANVTYLTTSSQIEASASALLAKFELDATDNFILSSWDLISNGLSLQ